MTDDSDSETTGIVAAYVGIMHLVVAAGVMSRPPSVGLVVGLMVLAVLVQLALVTKDVIGDGRVARSMRRARTDDDGLDDAVEAWTP